MAAKGPSRSHAPKGGEVPNEPVSQKPLTTTLLQEFQNLKDKFKNDDDVQEKGIGFSSIDNKPKVMLSCSVSYVSLG